MYPEIAERKLAVFWNERLNYECLNYENPDLSMGSKAELKFVIIASLIAGLIAKLPAIFSIDNEFFYTRNAGFIVFPLLILFFALKNKPAIKKIIFISFAILFSIVFINLMPDNKSDTLILSCIFLPLFLWSILGYVFKANEHHSYEKRLNYLRYNGDLIVITGIIMIAGVILTGITIGLFSLIGLEIQNFYREYVVISGLAASPIVGTYIVQTNPKLVNKVSPLIAKIFCPLILITLIVYLIAIAVTGKDPYNDREFLLLYNGLLILVMAIIVFSVAGTSRSDFRTHEILILFLLSAVTVIINLSALSAIVFRISEWGITPNRLAVLGSNILILTNLLIVAYMLFRLMINKCSLSDVEKSITAFLPVYCLWAVIVAFIFPFIFGFNYGH